MGVLNEKRCKPEKQKVIDVTGAGDIALCILVYIWLADKDLNLACRIVNFVCGKSIQHIGNYKLSINDIRDYYIPGRLYMTMKLKNKRW